MAELARETGERDRPTPALGASNRASAAAGASSQLDSLIHERARLAIVSILAARDRVSFVELKSILKATDGNVSAHARKLEEAGYIAAHKRFERRVPRTEYELTEDGRQALERYLAHMEALIRTVRRRQ